jgi:hypothetical protein
MGDGNDDDRFLAQAVVDRKRKPVEEQPTSSGLKAAG